MVPLPAVAAPGAVVPSVAVTVTVVAAATGASVVMETTPVLASIVQGQGCGVQRVGYGSGCTRRGDRSDCAGDSVRAVDRRGFHHAESDYDSEGHATRKGRSCGGVSGGYGHVIGTSRRQDSCTDNAGRRVDRHPCRQSARRSNCVGVGEDTADCGGPGHGADCGSERGVVRRDTR